MPSHLIKGAGTTSDECYKDCKLDQHFLPPVTSSDVVAREDIHFQDFRYVEYPDIYTQHDGENSNSFPVSNQFPPEKRSNGRDISPLIDCKDYSNNRYMHYARQIEQKNHDMHGTRPCSPNAALGAGTLPTSAPPLLPGFMDSSAAGTPSYLLDSKVHSTMMSIDDQYHLYTEQVRKKESCIDMLVSKRDNFSELSLNLRASEDVGHEIRSGFDQPLPRQTYVESLPQKQEYAESLLTDRDLPLLQDPFPFLRNDEDRLRNQIHNFDHDSAVGRSDCPNRNIMSSRSLLNCPSNNGTRNTNKAMDVHFSGHQEDGPPTEAKSLSYFVKNLNRSERSPYEIDKKTELQPSSLISVTPEDQYLHDNIRDRGPYQSISSHPDEDNRIALPRTNVSPCRTEYPYLWEMNDLVRLTDIFNNDEPTYTSPTYATKPSECQETSEYLEMSEVDNDASEPRNDVAEGALVGPLLDQESHRNLVTRFTFAVMLELEIVTFCNRDRRGNRGKTRIGSPGLACRYCQGSSSRTGRYFPSSLKTLTDSKKSLFPMYRHLASCQQCPAPVKNKLHALFATHTSERRHKRQHCHGGLRSFYRSIWESLHPVPKANP